jgi:hypothetical protein
MTEVTKLRRLRRMSHFMLDKPSVTLRKGGLYFSSSAVEDIKITDFKNCYICIKDGVGVDEATEVYLDFNNEPASDENCPIKIGAKGVGAYVSSMGTVLNQLTHAKVLLEKKRNERRFFLKKDNTINAWFFNFAPQFCEKSRNFDDLQNHSAIYQLCFRGTINRIGETNNLKRRIAEHKANQIPFDEVRYCNMNKFSDDDRKNWETFHIDLYVRDNNGLPPYNFQNGRQIN